MVSHSIFSIYIQRLSEGVSIRPSVTHRFQSCVVSNGLHNRYFTCYDLAYSPFSHRQSALDIPSEEFSASPDVKVPRSRHHSPLIHLIIEKSRDWLSVSLEPRSLGRVGASGPSRCRPSRRPSRRRPSPKWQAQMVIKKKWASMGRDRPRSAEVVRERF